MSNGPTAKAEQKDRLATLLNDIAVRKDTMASRTASDIAQEAQGRFAKDTTIIGTRAASLYPRLPESNPWNASAAVPPEPSLGYSVEDHEPVGEAHELAASLGGNPTATDEGKGTEALSSSFPNPVERNDNDGESSAFGDPSGSHLPEVSAASEAVGFTPSQSPRSTFRKRRF